MHTVVGHGNPHKWRQSGVPVALSDQSWQAPLSFHSFSLTLPSTCMRATCMLSCTLLSKIGHDSSKHSQK
eukprot:1158830-Pelagomonas_calceolata.AAC.10